MDFLLSLFLYCAVFIVGTLVLLYRDATVLNTGPIGLIRQLFGQIASRIIPSKIQSFLLSLVNYLLFKRHAGFLLLYLFGCVVAHMFWIVDILPILNKKYPNQNHTLWPFVAASVNYYFLHKAWTVDPGEVTARNCEVYRRVYKYDDALYEQHKICSTCNIVKPARSKHCSSCNRCVHRFDHHCIWTNNCVAAFTHHYFILFKASLIVVYLQAMHISTDFLMEFAEDVKLFNASYVDDDNDLQPITISIACQHLFMQYPRVVFLDIGCFVMTILVGIFLCQHLYLISTNQTTNERHKISSLQYYYTYLAKDTDTNSPQKRQNGREHKKDNNKNKNDSPDKQTVRQIMRDRYRPYSRGVVNNFMEVFFPHRFIETRLKER